MGDEVVVLRPGGQIAQAGTPQDILARPADDFVTSFIGADRSKRALHLDVIDGQQVVLDADGGAIGVLDEDRA